MELQELYNQYDKNIEELDAQIAKIEAKKDDLFSNFLKNRDKSIDEVFVNLEKEKEEIRNNDTLLDIIIKKIKK
jgi:prefoldin subunit 5